MKGDIAAAKRELKKLQAAASRASKSYQALVQKTEAARAAREDLHPTPGLQSSAGAESTTLWRPVVRDTAPEGERRERPRLRSVIVQPAGLSPPTTVPAGTPTTRPTPSPNTTASGQPNCLTPGASDSYWQQDSPRRDADTGRWLDDANHAPWDHVEPSWTDDEADLIDCPTPRAMYPDYSDEDEEDPFEDSEEEYPYYPARSGLDGRRQDQWGGRRRLGDITNLRV